MRRLLIPLPLARRRQGVGCCVEHVSSSGTTAMAGAVCKGHLPIVKYLHGQLTARGVATARSMAFLRARGIRFQQQKKPALSALITFNRFGGPSLSRGEVGAFGLKPDRLWAPEPPAFLGKGGSMPNCRNRRRRTKSNLAHISQRRSSSYGASSCWCWCSCFSPAGALGYQEKLPAHRTVDGGGVVVQDSVVLCNFPKMPGNIFVTQEAE